MCFEFIISSFEHKFDACVVTAKEMVSAEMRRCLQKARNRILLCSGSTGGAGWVGTESVAADRDMDGNEVKMDTFKGDVLCVVNVASK